MRAADLITAGLLFLVGAVVLADAVRLGTGWGTDGPRSGFFPMWLAVGLLALSATLLVQAWRRTASPPFVTRERLGPVLKVLGPAAGLVVATHVLGLYVAAGLYIGGYMRWVGRHPWLAVALCGAGIPVVAFAVFEIWFLVPMPKGPLEAWLGY